MSAGAEIWARRYKAADEPLWNACVAGSKNGTFLMDRGFMDYHADRFEDWSWMVFRQDKPVAVLPANQGAEGQVISHGGLTYGGLVSTSRLSGADTLAAFSAVLCEMRAEGAETPRYKPVPHIYHTVPAEEDLHALFLHNARLIRSDLASAIHLPSFKGFAKSKRAGVKAAAKAGLKVMESQDWTGFWSLLDALLAERHDTRPTHTLAEISLLVSRFPEQIRLFTATLDGLPLAGLVIFDCGSTVHVQYIASNEIGRANGAIDAIVQHLVQVVYADRQWFDFGISTTDAGRQLNTGLSRQKEMFGARSVVYQQFDVDLRAVA